MPDDLTVYAGVPLPQGAIRLARPKLLWRIWPQVRSVSLRIDGREIEARYDSSLRAVVGMPLGPLSTGKHQVRCEVEFDGGQTTNRSWTFSVAPGSPSELFDTLTPDERSTLNLVNSIRRGFGLRALTIDSSLLAAARAHGVYLVRNGKGGHLEESRLPEFVGRTPADRARAFGATEEQLVEDVAVLRRSDDRKTSLGIEATIGLFEAPYHRLPFLNPFLNRMGISDQSVRRDGIVSATVLLFGGANLGGSGATTVVSPMDGQSGVPVRWNDSEMPDPLRLHDGVRPPVGFPILFAHFAGNPEGGKRSPIRCDGAALYGPDGNRVEVLVNSPQADAELGGQAILLVPRRPLKPRSVYRVSVAARDGAGRNLSKVWKFKTAD